jgi:hypothetical protein
MRYRSIVKLGQLVTHPIDSAPIDQIDSTADIRR